MLAPRRTLLPVASLACAALALLLVASGLQASVDDHRAKPTDGNRFGLARFRGGATVRGECARRPCIALTFDDGPEHTTTPAILDELDRRNIRATFFVTGHRMAGDGEVAARNRAVLQDTYRRGHLVGNHTFHHDNMDEMDERTLARELDTTSELIERTLGVRTFLFRAPYGALQSQRAVRAVFSRGLTPVFWAIDSRDWAAHSPEEVLANFRAGLDDSPRGGVVLFHDTQPRTVLALPLVLDEIDARNRDRRARHLPAYEFVGLEELWQRAGSNGAASRRASRRH